MLIIFISLCTRILVTKNARKSETGQDNQTPFKLKNSGSINIDGIKNSSCLDSVIIRAGEGFPIAWNRLPPIIKKPNNGKNIAIVLIGSTLFAISSLPPLKRLNKGFGKNMIIINPVLAIAVVHTTASLKTLFTLEYNLAP